MFSILLLFVCAAVTNCDKDIRYAAVLFRHGDRTPVSPYPTDPWKDESLWPVKFGQLTNVGKKQHYELGIWLRKRYAHLLSKNFNPTEIYIRSTDVDRTLMSAQANLAGLYPPSGNTVWNDDLMWQPIPVHTVPETADELLAMKKPCPAFDKEYDRFIHSKSYTDRLSRYQTLMDYLSSYTGMNVKTYYDIDDIFSTLYIEQLYNFTLPHWTHSVYPDKMRAPACYSFTTQTDTPLLARLKVGPLLKHIHTHLVRAIKGRAGGKYRKVQLYSAHDLNIGSMLNALGLYDGKCPCYTSAIFFELIFDNATCTHNVRISYRNFTNIKEPVVLHIPYCGPKCPIDRFTKLYENLLTVNWEYECSKQFPPLLGASLIIGLCIFMSIYIAHLIHFRRIYPNFRNNLAYSTLATPPVASIVDTVKIIET